MGGQAYSFCFSTGGTPTPTVSKTDGTLPPGLNLASDGTLSDDERRAAQEIAAQLGMTPAQALGVISITEEGASA